MSREIFELLWSCIYFADNADEAIQTNRLYKIKPLLDEVVTQFQNVCEPNPTSF